MSETSRSRLTHLVPLAAVQVFGLGCGLASVRWSSAIVPPEVLGLYALLTSTQMFGMSVTHQGAVQYTQRHWSARPSGRTFVPALLRALNLPTLWLALGLAPVALLLTATTEGALGFSWWGWLVLINLFGAIAQLAYTALQAEERYWAYFAASAISSATRSFLPLFLVSVSGVSLLLLGGGFLAHAAIAVAAGAAFLAAAWTRPVESTTAPPPQPAGRLFASFAAVGLCSWLAAISPRWFAAAALTPETTGFFMLAANLATIVPSTVSMIGLSYTFPPLFAAARAGADIASLRRRTDRAALVSLLIAQAGLALLPWLGPQLVGILVDARYAVSMEWLLAAGGGTLATVSLPLYTNLLVAAGRERQCLVLAGASAGTRIALLAAATVFYDDTIFRWTLSLLAWPAFAVEWYVTRRLLERPQ